LFTFLWRVGQLTETHETPGFMPAHSKEFDTADKVDKLIGVAMAGIDPACHYYI
jgi:hypothetical protein